MIVSHGRSQFVLKLNIYIYIYIYKYIGDALTHDSGPNPTVYMVLYSQTTVKKPHKNRTLRLTYISKASTSRGIISLSLLITILLNVTWSTSTCLIALSDSSPRTVLSFPLPCMFLSIYGFVPAYNYRMFVSISILTGCLCWNTFALIP